MVHLIQNFFSPSPFCPVVLLRGSEMRGGRLGDFGGRGYVAFDGLESLRARRIADDLRRGLVQSAARRSRLRHFYLHLLLHLPHRRALFLLHSDFLGRQKHSAEMARAASPSQEKGRTRATNRHYRWEDGTRISVYERNMCEHQIPIPAEWWIDSITIKRKCVRDGRKFESESELTGCAKLSALTYYCCMRP